MCFADEFRDALYYKRGDQVKCGDSPIMTVISVAMDDTGNVAVYTTWFEQGTQHGGEFSLNSLTDVEGAEVERIGFQPPESEDKPETD